MSETFKVYVVDDDPFVLDIIRGILEADYPVETFSSVALCQQRLDAERPGMFLLDVRMPGTDGYTFCRQIKDDDRLRQIPVTFVSSQDSIEARLKGYDAGGEDFIIKPFVPEEVLRKVRVAHQIADGKRAISQQLEDSELLSSLVLSNMDEYAILMRFIRALISLKTDQDVATGLLDMLRGFRIDGVAQTRISQRTLTISAHGNDLPLETSIVDHVRGMGRIFEFGNRCVNNYERLTLMISNMPVHDPELCGRLRDHLCIATECAEAQLKAIETEETNARNQAGIREALAHIDASTGSAHTTYLRNTAACAELLMTLEMDFSKAFAHIGMSNSDELTLANLVNSFSEKMLKLLDNGEEAQQAMDTLGKRLGQLNGVA